MNADLIAEWQDIARERRAIVDEWRALDDERRTFEAERDALRTDTPGPSGQPPAPTGPSGPTVPEAPPGPDPVPHDTNGSQPAKPNGATLLGYPEAARHLSVSARTVRRLRARGELPAITIGRNVRFLETDLDAYLAQHYG